MACKGNSSSLTSTNGSPLGIEAKLWAAADALRNNMDAADYKHVVLGLILLKYISDAFEAKHAELVKKKAEGDPTLRTIARELVETLRKNTIIDWTIRENVRANLRALVKRIPRKYGYPPAKQEKATFTVLEQAEALSAHWAVA